ncbi:MAG: CCA tRNA nucleotidyltransferase, partial [Candidatus Diapherotrites archaeon]|nr:CCA tRNA nucleotidyltransferase [Candidatus Diapherotrites archaeon]
MPRKHDKILTNVLKEIKPTKAEHNKELKKAAQLLKEIKSFKGRHVDAVFCGSAARGTELKGDSDIDLFVLYPLKASEDTLEEEGLSLGKAMAKKHKAKYELRYASHPYVKIPNLNGYDVEIVPAFKIKTIKDFKSAVDRTPLHQAFIQKNLKEKQKDEVRLLKKFCKGLEVYGAEMSTRGFPGYLLENLVIQYGSFQETLEAASKWNYHHVIDLGKHYRIKKEAVKKFSTPLIVIDPTDKKRNVGAAVSDNVFAKFVHYSREFIKNPSEEYFRVKQIKPKKVSDIRKKMSEKGTYFIAIK